MLNRKTKETHRSSIVNVNSLLNMEWVSNFQTLGKRAFRTPSTKSKLSQRILRTLIDNPESNLLGDENTQLNGIECLEVILKLSSEIKAVTPKNGRVAILFPPSLAQSVSILSVMMADRIPVILNHWIDKKTLDHLITDNNLHSLITFPQPASDLAPLIPQIEFSDNLETVKSTKNGFFEKPVPDADTALILYTSGSTGNSKGVKIPEEALIYMIDLLIEKLRLGPDSVATITLPIFHTMALVTQFFPTFFAGGKSIIINTELSTGKLYRLIHQSNGTFVALISDMLKYCRDEKIKRDLPPANKIKLVQLAGGHINLKHLELAKELFPNALIYKGYGLTEAIRISMISSNDPLFLKNSAGYPLPDQIVEIRDEDNNSLPPETSGEIHVKGPNLMIGYEGNVKSRILKDGFLATGDFGSISKEGLIIIEGRRDHVFKSNGRKIACKELEEISIELPQILKAKCMAVTCEQKGLRPVLAVEIDTEQVDLFSKDWKNELVKILKNNLDPYKVPKDVIVTKIPVLANGKINHPKTEKLWEEKSNLEYLGKATFGCHFHSSI